MVGAIVVGCIGLIFLVLGFLIWKKEKISLLHEYHYDKVLPENKTAFCTISGWGISSIGLGLLVTAILLGVTESIWSFLAFGIELIIGLTLLLYAGNKYNR